MTAIAEEVSAWQLFHLYETEFQILAHVAVAMWTGDAGGPNLHHGGRDHRRELNPISSSRYRAGFSAILSTIRA